MLLGRVMALSSNADVRRRLVLDSIPGSESRGEMPSDRDRFFHGEKGWTGLKRGALVDLTTRVRIFSFLLRTIGNIYPV